MVEGRPIMMSAQILADVRKLPTTEEPGATQGRPVAIALERGVRALLAHQRDDGSWEGRWCGARCWRRSS